MVLLQVLPSFPSYPSDFAKISAEIATYLSSADPPVPYVAIEHFGSTSIPGLAAKPIIDIVIIVCNKPTAEAARDALMWQPSPTNYYKCIGDGGIRGRISMKHSDRELKPERNVYVIAEDVVEGMLSVKGYRDLRACLMKEENRDLFDEYAECKLKMVEEGVSDNVEYGQRKNAVVRKVLQRAGWSEKEIDMKEGLDTRIAGEWAEATY